MKMSKTPLLIITPPKKWIPIHLNEIWEYRDLLYNFVLRDVKVRYKQTVLGLLWTIIQPLFIMTLFAIVFGTLINMSTDNMIPYPIYIFVALTPWTLFSEGLTRSATGMVINASIITKVYFPRLIIPISGILSPLVDFLITFTLLLFMMAYYGYYPTITAITIPLLVLLTIITSFSIGLWISSFNIKYRDFQQTIPFLIQVMLYASPIVYPIATIPAKYHLIYGINPMVGVIEGFRWALLGTRFPVIELCTSIIVVTILLIGGLFYFKKTEQYFADVV